MSGVGATGGPIAFALPFFRRLEHFFVFADDPDDETSGRHLRVRVSLLAKETFLRDRTL